MIFQEQLPLQRIFMAHQDYSSLTINSPNPVKRWSHRTRFKVALGIIDPQPNDSILDYGTGDAFTLKLIKEAQPSAKCIGYDPFMDPEAHEVKAKYPDIELLTDIAPLEGQSFAKVLCFETLEHFDGRFLETRLDELTGLVAPQGCLVISVPIEIGPASLFKNVVRVQMGKVHPGTTFTKVVQSTLYQRNVGRSAADTGGYINSHVGFDYRSLLPKLEKRNFRLMQTSFSPLAGFATDAVNSQIFLRFLRNA
jgi:SAM-dependent methyltransferase